MFYSTDILSRRDGKLGLFWMFANFHGDHGPKIQRREVIEAKITEAWCATTLIVLVALNIAGKQVKAPRQPFSLRLSSSLLIGISRVYNRQLLYLWDDLRAVWVRVQKKAQLRDAEAQLVLETKTARAEAITLAAPGASQMLLDLEGVNIEQILADADQGLFTVDLSFQNYDDDVETIRGRARTRGSRRASAIDQEPAAITLHGENFTLGAMELDLNDGGMDFGDMTLIDVSAFADISAEQRELELRLGKGAIGLGDMVGLDADPMVLDMGGDYGEINLDLDDAAHHTVPDETQGLPAMEPLGTPAPQQTRKRRRAVAEVESKSGQAKDGKRQRLIVDEYTQLESTFIKAYLSDTTKIVKKSKQMTSAHGDIVVFFAPSVPQCFQNRELLEVFERTARPGLLGPVRYGSLFFNKQHQDKDEALSPLQEETAPHELVELDLNDQGGGFEMDLNAAADEIEVARDVAVPDEPFEGPSTTVLSLPWSTTPALPTTNDGKLRLSRRASEESLDTPFRRRRRTLSRRGSVSLDDPSAFDGFGPNEQEYDVMLYGEGQESGDIPSAMKEEARDFFRYLAGKMNANGVMHYDDLLEHGASRLIAAKAFYHVLVLSTMGMVEPAQDAPYSDIRVAMAH